MFSLSLSQNVVCLNDICSKFVVAVATTNLEGNSKSQPMYRDLNRKPATIQIAVNRVLGPHLGTLIKLKEDSTLVNPLPWCCSLYLDQPLVN